MKSSGSLIAGRWLLSAASQRGYSHRRNGTPNQDYYDFRGVGTFSGEVLVLAVADGAGSAPHSASGSRIAASTAVNELTKRVNKNPACTIKPHLMRSALRRAIKRSRNEIKLHAKREHIEFRELATTLAIAVVNDAMLATAHIGDGVIITRNSDGQYYTVSGPQNGEYANETYFITSGQDPIVSIIQNPDVSAISLITDGLQPISVVDQTGTPHPGFFDPIFETMATDNDPSRTANRISDFISSERVWLRTMDDVTIIAATLKEGN